MITERRQQEIQNIIEENFPIILQKWAKSLAEWHKGDESGFADFDAKFFINAVFVRQQEAIIENLFDILFDMGLTCQGEEEIFKETLTKHIDGKWSLTMNIIKSWMEFFEA